MTEKDGKGRKKTEKDGKRRKKTEKDGKRLGAVWGGPMRVLIFMQFFDRHKSAKTSCKSPQAATQSPPPVEKQYFYKIPDIFPTLCDSAQQ